MIRVVIADPNSDYRFLVRLAIERAETLACVVVGEAAGPVEVVSVVLDTEPDLLLIDVDMPGIDAAALLAQLTTTYPAMTVVALSGFTFDGARVDATRHGAVAQLEKGLSPIRLVHRLVQAMGGDLHGSVPVTR